MSDDMRDAFEEAKQHLFWLKENRDKTDTYTGRIVGYTECLEQWQAAIQSLPRVTEEELAEFTATYFAGSRYNPDEFNQCLGFAKALATKFPQIIKEEGYVEKV